MIVGEFAEWRCYRETDREAFVPVIRLRNLVQLAIAILAGLVTRFSIRYCTGGLGRDEVEAVGFDYSKPDEMMRRDDPTKLREGRNRLDDGEEIFVISEPATGLWPDRRSFG